MSRVFIALAVLSLAACQGVQEKKVMQVVRDAGWDQMETITVELDEFSFSPSELSLKKGQPYKLKIRNVGTTKHYFTAREFFRSVAARKVQSNADGEIKAPYFSALEIFPGRSLDFYFVPVRPGTYDLLCTIEGHAEQGMTGSITIDP